MVLHVCIAVQIESVSLVVCCYMNKHKSLEQVTSSIAHCSSTVASMSNETEALYFLQALYD